MKNGDFLTQIVKQRASYIVEGLIASNRLSMWASPPGHGKSLVATGLGYSVAYEAPFLGMKTAPGSVMFIDSENRLDLLQQRIIKIKNGLENDGYSKKAEVDFQHYTGFLLDNNSTWPPIEKEIKAIEPTLIIIDHLACFHHQDENLENQMKKVSAGIEYLMTIKDSSVLVLHHFNKLDRGTFFVRLRGSSAIYAKTDVASEIRTLSINQGKLEKVGYIPQPRKDITPAPVRIKIEEGQDWIKFVHDGSYKPIDDPRMDELAHKFYHTFLEPQDTEDITVAKMIKIIARYATDNEVRDCLRFLEHVKGLITSERKGKGAPFHYQLTNPTGATILECPWCNEQFLV